MGNHMNLSPPLKPSKRYRGRSFDALRPPRGNQPSNGAGGPAGCQGGAPGSPRPRG